MPVSLNSGAGIQLYDRTTDAVAQRKAEVQALARFMKHFHVPISAVQPRQADATRAWFDVFDDCVETLEEHWEIAIAEGIKFALEPHVGIPFESSAQVRRLLDAIPEMPLIYDPSHFAAQGIDVQETDRLLDRAAWVHVRDGVSGTIRAHFGEGDVDFDWIFRSLRDPGYDGGFSIEYLKSMDKDIAGDTRRGLDAALQYFPR